MNGDPVHNFLRICFGEITSGHEARFRDIANRLAGKKGQLLLADGILDVLHCESLVFDTAGKKWRFQTMYHGWFDGRSEERLEFHVVNDEVRRWFKFHPEVTIHWLGED